MDMCADFLLCRSKATLHGGMLNACRRIYSVFFPNYFDFFDFVDNFN